MAPVTGTTSATVIQSMPSMKLVRLMNQIPARRINPRSIHQGSIATRRSSAGSAAITMPTATPCRRRRDSGVRPLMSSTAPTTASSAAAAVSARNWLVSLVENALVEIAQPAQATVNVAMMTAAPPPCGVASRCDERAFGRAKA
jgi:hypothetical protein